MRISYSSYQKTIVTPLILLLEEITIYRSHGLDVHFSSLRTNLLFNTWKRKRKFNEPKFFDNGDFYLDTPYYEKTINMVRTLAHAVCYFL